MKGSRLFFNLICVGIGMWLGKATTELIIKQKIQMTFNYDISELEKGLQCLSEEREYLQSIKGDNK